MVIICIQIYFSPIAASDSNMDLFIHDYLENLLNGIKTIRKTLLGDLNSKIV